MDSKIEVWKNIPQNGLSCIIGIYHTMTTQSTGSDMFVLKSQFLNNLSLYIKDVKPKNAISYTCVCSVLQK